MRRIAYTAIAVIAIVYTMSAQTTNPSEPSSAGVSPPSAEEVAAGRASANANRWAIAWILGSAIVTAWLGWWVLEKSNKAQVLTLARYELEIARTNQSNLALRGKVATLETKAAEQQERAAKAEKSLLELQKNVAPREFNKDEFHALVRSLARGPKGHVDIVFQTGNPETRLFAGWIASALDVSGWTYSLSELALSLPRAGFGRGVGIAIRDGRRHPARLKTLHDALVSAGIPSVGGLVYLDPNLPEDAVQLSVWPKPVTPRAGW